MPHSRNQSTHSHVIRENSPPDDPIGLAADRVDEGAGNARGRQQDDFRLAGAFDIPPAYEEGHGKHGHSHSHSHSRSHSRSQSRTHNKSRSRSRNPPEAAERERGEHGEHSGTQTQTQPQPHDQDHSQGQAHQAHAHVQQDEQAPEQPAQRDNSATEASAKHLPELGYGHSHARSHDRSASGERRRSQPIGLGSDRINEGSGGARHDHEAGQTYTFSADGSK
ncbi:hypothetical protein E3P99_02523 [Wallemia hederae]|uniref:Uncharacterized protein n=1 Tax=Wallemia hederae TaxID=1540922 RepID=A0A4T0FK31_9BASI|nr:hypothetical protein E3P99_02523 [Wallemia hederae]